MTTYSRPKDLQKLGSGSADVDLTIPANPALLERFPNPGKFSRYPGPNPIWIGSPDAPSEFTSLCPKTGQPDFAQIMVHYQPREWCVESKSWKLYLQSFRDLPEFHESCAQRIKDDLVDLLDPVWVSVQCEFTPRGGIPFNPQAYWEASLSGATWEEMYGRSQDEAFEALLRAGMPEPVS